MKKVILLSVVLLIITLYLVFFKSSPFNQNQTVLQPSPSSAAAVQIDVKPNLKNLEIKKEAPTKYSLKSLNNDLVELGTERHSPPKPFLKLHKWDSEVSLKVSIPYDVVSEDPDTTGGKLTYTTVDNKKIEFLAKAPEEIITKDSKGEERKFTINEEGGVEFNTILNEKPASNILVFPLETQNLDFFYQPPLNKENQDSNLTCSETECKDKDGNIVNYRPENVVGSYAVYYKDNKSGDYSKMGGKNYMTGKAFHIYRPKIKDASNKEIWGELRVDKQANALTITVNQTWLDNAVYPVVIDPTFGYTTTGISQAAMNNVIRGSYFTISEVGIPSSISTYMRINGSCFTGDTLITMANGSYKKIKDIKTGDKVGSYNVETGQFVIETVKETFYHPSSEAGEYYLTITTDNDKTVEITPNHPVFVSGEWIEAGELEIADELFSDQNQPIKITSIRKVYKKVPLYNLEISNNHVYFANFLVHNKASFGFDTKVNMADGSQKIIKEIKKGDQALSYNLESGQTESAEVLDTVTHDEDSYFIITDEQNRKLKVTASHPVYANGNWKLVRQLEKGDLLFSQPNLIRVKSIKKVAKKISTFDLTVAKNHNYFAEGKLVDDGSILIKTGDIGAGSKILLENNTYKKIEELRIGDKLITYDPTSRRRTVGQVTVFRIGASLEKVFIINHRLKLTSLAKVYTPKGEKSVKDLQLSDQLINEQGQTEAVFSIVEEPPQDTYFIGVSANHNFFADGSLVHNGTGYAKTAIYKQSDSTQVATSSENTYTQGTNTSAWRTFTVSSNPTLSAATNYWLYVWGSIGTLVDMTIYYDTGGNGVYKSVTYGTWSNPLTDTTTDNYKYSIYATYTVPQTNFQGVDMQGVNIN